jgi:hypothetical protein
MRRRCATERDQEHRGHLREHRPVGPPPSRRLPQDRVDRVPVRQSFRNAVHTSRDGTSVGCRPREKTDFASPSAATILRRTSGPQTASPALLELTIAPSQLLRHEILPLHVVCPHDEGAAQVALRQRRRRRARSRHSRHPRSARPRLARRRSQDVRLDCRCAVSRDWRVWRRVSAGWTGWRGSTGAVQADGRGGNSFGASARACAVSRPCSLLGQ